MTFFKKISEFFGKKSHLLIVSGIAAAGLFVLGWHFLMTYVGRIDLIPFLDTPFKNMIAFSVIVFLFFVALGEFAANIGQFSFVNYAVVTFFAALACYVITPIGEILSYIDLSDTDFFIAALNSTYRAWLIVYFVVYICSLIFGLLINRKTVFAKKGTKDN